jgi:hypothetical protein
MVVHLHLHLILKPALLNQRLRKANAPAISYSDKGCFHDYNVITSGRGVNPPSATHNVVLTGGNVGSGNVGPPPFLRVVPLLVATPSRLPLVDRLSPNCLDMNDYMHPTRSID